MTEAAEPATFTMECPTEGCTSQVTLSLPHWVGDAGNQVHVQDYQCDASPKDHRGWIEVGTGKLL